MTLIAPDGFVVLSPSRLSSLECPRRGKHLLEAPKTGPTTPLRTGIAAHAVLAALCRGNWPEEAFDLIPGLARTALRSEWPTWASDGPEFDEVLADTTEMLRQFLFAWTPPPAMERPNVEAWATFEHQGSRLRLTGRLDLLIPPLGVAESRAMLLDYKSGKQPLVCMPDGAPPPLAVVAQAALARAKLGLRCGVEVTYLYLRTNGQEVWILDHDALVEGWRRIREIAGDILADRWPERPGEYCDRCRLADCQWAPRVLDAEQLGLMDGLDAEGV